MVPSATGSHQPNGIRFECSWSNSVQDLSPTPNRRTSTSRAYNPSSETDSNAFRLSHRKNSSSGYGSGETTAPLMAATLTVSHPAGSSSSTESGRRLTQPYERRCRSTCSITLQTGQENPIAGQSVDTPTGGYPLHPFHPHHFRRCSEGETWNSHTKMPQFAVPSLVQSPCPLPTPRPATPAASATPVDKVRSVKNTF